MNNHWCRVVKAAAAIASLGAVWGAAMLSCGCAARERAGESAPADGALHYGPPLADEGLPHRVLVDGEFDEWPTGVRLLADEHYIYARLTLPGVATLQANEHPVALLVDLDGSASTGVSTSRAVDGLEPVPGFGADLKIVFSPARPDGRPGTGTSVFAWDEAGRRRNIGHSAADAHFATTYASDEFEVRFSRHMDDVQGVNRSALAGAAASVVAARIDGPGVATVLHGPDDGELPGRAQAPWRADVTIPPPEPDAIRIVSYNVEWTAPLENPEPFARVLRALRPDVVLLQEWDKTDAAGMAEWFNEHVPGSGRWRAIDSEGFAVGIVTRHSIRRLGPERLSIDPDARARIGGTDRPVRWVGAMINTPVGDLAAATLHLKCCGSAGSSEDLERIAEAEAINGAMRGALADARTPLRILLGDFNIVGTRTPLDVARAGLDIDGSDLVELDLRVLGDAAYYTWHEPDSRFSAGRLDAGLVGGARAEVVNAFGLDARRLSDGALGRAGIERDDTLASDHLPLVVDLRPVR